MRIVLFLLLLGASAPALADSTPAPTKPVTQGNDPRDGMISTKIHPGEQPAPIPPSKAGAQTEHSSGQG
jgi:hypothetical protein